MTFKVSEAIASTWKILYHECADPSKYEVRGPVFLLWARAQGWAAAAPWVRRPPGPGLCLHVQKRPSGEWAQNLESWISWIICYKYSLSFHKYICSFYSKDFPLYLLLVIRKTLKCIFSWSLYLKNESENLESGHLLTIVPSFAALIPLYIS